MIDQNILYAECPCGSGRKFKFCCYPDVRGLLPKNPSQADVTRAIRQKSELARLAEHSDKIAICDLDRFQGLNSRGLHHLQAQRYDEAKEEFIKAKNEFGMLPTPYNNLALCAMAQGDVKEAEKWVGEVMRLFPTENPFGHAVCADLRFLKGDLVGALEVIERAERITPSSADQTVRLCESMAHFMDHERIVRYAKASGFADDPEVAYFLGIAFANLGKTDQAVRYLRIALRGRMAGAVKPILDGVLAGGRPPTICGDWMYFTPHYYTLFAGLFRSLKEGGGDQAHLSSEVAAELVEVEANGGLLGAQEVIAILSEGGVSKRAERMLNALRNDASRPKSVREAAETAYRKAYSEGGLGKNLQNLKLGGIQQMIITTEASSCVPLDAKDEELYTAAVRTCLNPKSKKADFVKAQRVLEEMHEKFPDNPVVANNYASALERVGRFDESVEIVRDCFAKHPEYVFGAANYLKLLMISGQMDEAAAMVKNYRLPQRVHPDAYLAWCRAEIRYYDMVGDRERARNVQKGIDLLRENFDRSV